MKPKEKAKELVKKFGLKFPMGSPDDFIFNQAIECALICVNEIQEHAQMVDGEYEGYTNTWYYFTLVEKEINNLKHNKLWKIEFLK